MEPNTGLAPVSPAYKTGTSLSMFVGHIITDTGFTRGYYPMATRATLARRVMLGVYITPLQLS